MKAKVLKEFDGVADGTTHPKRFVEGDMIEGSLASAMVAAGFAEPAGGKKALDGAPENKAKGAAASGRFRGASGGRGGNRAKPAGGAAAGGQKRGKRSADSGK